MIYHIQLYLDVYIWLAFAYQVWARRTAASSRLPMRRAAASCTTTASSSTATRARPTCGLGSRRFAPLVSAQRRARRRFAPVPAYRVYRPPPPSPRLRSASLPSPPLALVFRCALYVGSSSNLPTLAPKPAPTGTRVLTGTRSSGTGFGANTFRGTRGY